MLRREYFFGRWSPASTTTLIDDRNITQQDSSRCIQRAAIMSDCLQPQSPGAEVEYSVRMLRGPSIEGLQYLSNRLASASDHDAWLHRFIHEGGIEALFGCLEALSGCGFTDFTHSLLQLECVNSVRHVLDIPSGFRHVVGSQLCIDCLAKSLDTTNSLTKRQVFDLLSAICVFSADARNAVLRALDTYKDCKKTSYRFSVIMAQLHDSTETLHYRTAVLGFINCIIASTRDLQPRAAIRQEFIGLRLLDALAKLRYEDEDDMMIQCEAFYRLMMSDDDACSVRDGVDVQDCQQLFSAIFNKVCDSPKVSSLRIILLQMYYLETVSTHSDTVWRNLEKACEQFVLNHKLGQAEFLLRDSIRGIMAASTSGSNMASTASQTERDCSAASDAVATEERETQTESSERAARSSLDSGVDTDVDSPPPLPPKVGKPAGGDQQDLRCSCAMQVAERRKRTAGDGAADVRRPVARMRVLPWLPIHIGRSSTGQNVWMGKAINPPSVDFDRLEERFRDARSEAARAEFAYIAPRQRVGLHLLLRRLMDEHLLEIEDIAGSIESASTQKFELERLKELLEILPNAQQMQRIASIPDGADVEDDVDHLLVCLARIPECRGHIEAMVGREEIARTTGELRVCLAAMERTACFVRDNDDMQRLLLTVLDVGNFLNNGTGLGNACGFDLSALTSLVHVHSNVPRLSLLNHIAEEYPDVTTSLLKELKTVKEARRYSLADIEEMTSSMSTRVKELKKIFDRENITFRHQFSTFMERTSCGLFEIRSRTKRIKSLSSQLAVYLGVEKAPHPHLSDLIVTLCEFLNDLELAQRENSQRRLQWQQTEKRRRQLQQIAKNAQGKGVVEKCLEPVRRGISDVASFTFFNELTYAPRDGSVGSDDVDDTYALARIDPVTGRAFPKGAEYVKTKYNRDAQELSGSFLSPDNKPVDVGTRTPVSVYDNMPTSTPVRGGSSAIKDCGVTTLSPIKESQVIRQADKLRCPQLPLCPSDDKENNVPSRRKGSKSGKEGRSGNLNGSIFEKRYALRVYQRFRASLRRHSKAHDG
ncbi:PREDICTED: inverted formin-2-like isoform X2 [Priapulus caudatus]|uniref:Inverted formin-2-like isoform X2 n=1 Tax=Priapulus caudatus TaxID=37621 RepID=A0ABM1ED98_PRICU|nr:PREDICTED: inverted formin-2-like isoform X2 [Priapulus caudatus]